MHAGRSLADLTPGLDAVEHRHRDVHQHHVRLELLGHGQQGAPVRGGPDDLEPRLEQPRERFGQERVVIGQQDARAAGHRTDARSESGT